MIRRQIAEVEAERKAALSSEANQFPSAEKVRVLSKLGGVGETTATGRRGLSPNVRIKTTFGFVPWAFAEPLQQRRRRARSGDQQVG
jgi:hypothetical protein